MDPIFIIALYILVVDLAWLALVMKSKFAAQVERIQQSPMQVNMLGAILSYVFMILAVRFVSYPAATLGNSRLNPLFVGTMMGLAMYGVFDFTNYAIFKDYSLKLAVGDLAWGIFLNVSVLYVAMAVA